MAGSSGDARPPPASQAKQRAGPPWVQTLKKRMPRHQDEDSAEERSIAKTTPSGERWFQAEQFMLKRLAGVVCAAFDRQLRWSTSVAATPPTPAIPQVCGPHAETTTGAKKASALKGELRHTDLAMCAVLSKKALIGASGWTSETTSNT